MSDTQDKKPYVSNATDGTNQTDTHTTPTPITLPPSTEPHTLACGHRLHSAYAPTYNYTQCPSCRLTSYLTALLSSSAYILARGGVRTWREAIAAKGNQPSHILTWKQHTKGGVSKNKKKKNPVTPLLDENGDDVGYRACKIRLLRVLHDVEELAGLEARWDEACRARLDAGVGEVEFFPLRRLTARGALGAYWKAVEDGLVRRVERNSLAFARRRGCEWEALVLEACPDGDGWDGGSPEMVVRFSLGEVQREFVKGVVRGVMLMAGGWDGGNGVGAVVLKRGGSSGARVSFAEQVRVCSESDIDVIAESADDAGLVYKAPESVRPLNESPPRHWVHWRRGINNLSRRVPGPWAVSEGSEPVDTSGHRKEWEQWEEYLLMLNSEKDWDEEMTE